LSLDDAASLKVPWTINENEVPTHFPRLPAYALVYYDNEWRCAKIEEQKSDGTYRYKVEGRFRWGNNAFDSKDHGRYNESPNKWVSLIKKGIASR
jgi:hypothetical protein